MPMSSPKMTRMLGLPLSAISYSLGLKSCRVIAAAFSADRRASLDRSSERTGVEGLLQIVDAAERHRLGARCGMVAGRDDDDRKRRSGRLEATEQVEARHAFELDVEDESDRSIADAAVEKRFGAGEGRRAVAARLQQPFDRRAHRRIVIDDGDHRAL